MRAEEFFKKFEDTRYELINGEPVPKQESEGHQHDTVVNLIGFPVGQHVVAHKLGYMFPAGTGFLLQRNPDLVRDPDLAFCTHERMKTESSSEYCFFAPTLAIEVVAPTDTASDMLQRVTDYFEGGTQMVWVVYPEQAKIMVHYPFHRVVVLEKSDFLDGGDVLPGFSIEVGSIFPED